MSQQHLSVETEQVRLRLTEDQETLDALRQRRRMKPNPHAKGRMKGVEELVIMFDGKPFHFAPGVVIVCGRRTANALRRDSAVIIGDDLTGEMVAAIEEIGKYDMSAGYQEHRSTATTCPVCYKDQETLQKLAKHLQTHREDRPDLFVDSEEGKDLDARPVVTNDETGEDERLETPLLDSSTVG